MGSKSRRFVERPREVTDRQAAGSGNLVQRRCAGEIACQHFLGSFFLPWGKTALERSRDCLHSAVGLGAMSCKGQGHMICEQPTNLIGSPERRPKRQANMLDCLVDYAN